MAAGSGADGHASNTWKRGNAATGLILFDDIADVVGGKRVTRLPTTLPPSWAPLALPPSARYSPPHFSTPHDSFHPQTRSFNPNRSRICNGWCFLHRVIDTRQIVTTIWESLRCERFFQTIGTVKPLQLWTLNARVTGLAGDWKIIIGTALCHLWLVDYRIRWMFFEKWITKKLLHFWVVIQKGKNKQHSIFFKISFFRALQDTSC